MSTALAVWFWTLVAAVLIWFVLASRLNRMLRENHSDVYAALGSPSLFANNTPRNNWLSVKFLLSGSYRDLGDKQVTRLCEFMRVFWVGYAIWFVGPVVWILLSPLGR